MIWKTRSDSRSLSGLPLRRHFGARQKVSEFLAAQEGLSYLFTSASRRSHSVESPGEACHATAAPVRVAKSHRFAEMHLFLLGIVFRFLSQMLRAASFPKFPDKSQRPKHNVHLEMLDFNFLIWYLLQLTYTPLRNPTKRQNLWCSSHDLDSAPNSCQTPILYREHRPSPRDTGSVECSLRFACLACRRNCYETICVEPPPRDLALVFSLLSIL